MVDIQPNIQSSIQSDTRPGTQPDSQLGAQLDVRQGTQAYPARVRYIPALDGIRALAVLAVIAYHMSVPWMAGGLLGVTVFFVLSGYLITSLLLQELEDTKTICLSQFWLRRVRRLFPAIVLVICGTAILCALFNQELMAKMKPDIIPSLLFFNNWWQIFHDVSYFDAMGAPSPLTHFWSLAIEEQFYLVWPVLLLGLYKLGARKRQLRVVTLVLAGASVLLMAALFVPGEDPSRVYYGTDTRAFSLLIGALLAFLWPAGHVGERRAGKRPAGERQADNRSAGAPRTAASRAGAPSTAESHAGKPHTAGSRVGEPRTAEDRTGDPRTAGNRVGEPRAKEDRVGKPRTAGNRAGGQRVRPLQWIRAFVDAHPFALEAIGILSLVGLACMFVFVDGMSPFLYYGGLCLCSMLTALVIAAAVVPGSYLGRALGCKPLVWIGVRSYGIYLWHLPIVLLIAPLLPSDPGPWWALLLELALIFAISELSYRFIENPIRKGAIGAVVRSMKEHRATSDRKSDILRERQSADGDARNQQRPCGDARNQRLRPRVDVRNQRLRARSEFQRIRRVLGASALSPILPALITFVVVIAGAGVAIALSPDSVQSESAEQLMSMEELAASEARRAEIEANIARTTECTANLEGDPAAWQLLAIGDSVMLGASEALLERHPSSIVDAAVNRSTQEAIDIYSGYVSAGWNGSAVVFALGANNPLDTELDDVRNAIGLGTPLFVVTVRAPHVDWQDSNNDMIRSFAASHDNTYLVDWYAYSNDHDEFFYDDDTHLNEVGRPAYADCLDAAIREYFPAAESGESAEADSSES